MSNLMSCVVSSRLERQGLLPRPCEGQFADDEHLKNKVETLQKRNCVDLLINQQLVKKSVSLILEMFQSWNETKR